MLPLVPSDTPRAEDREIAALVATVARSFCIRLAPSHGFGAGIAPLTSREHTVLRALLTGDSEKQIARTVGLTTRFRLASDTCSGQRIS